MDAPHPLDEATIGAFRRDGHVTLRALASAEEIAAVRPAVLGVVAAVAGSGDRQGRLDDYGALFTQVTNAWRLDGTVRRFVFARRFARAAAELMGVRGVRLYHDQALVKEPGGRPTPWHQDQYYWPLDTDDVVTLWMPLVDVDAAMGPMVFASGSHREDWDAGAISEEGGTRLDAEIRRRGLSLGGGRPLAAGDATFHRGRTLHCAGANGSGRRREVITVIYQADGARVAEPGTGHRRADRDAFLPGLAAGDLAASPLNPLLYRAGHRLPSSSRSKMLAGGHAMHVRVCVDCGEEYRPEIAACADCGGRLEDRHGDDAGSAAAPTVETEEADEAGDAAFTESVLHADRASALTGSADRLMESRIAFRLRPAAKGEGSGYHLLVAEGDRDRALAILGIAAGLREGECPACGTRLAERVLECPECGLAVGDEPEPA